MTPIIVTGMTTAHGDTLDRVKTLRLRRGDKLSTLELRAGHRGGAGEVNL